MSVYDTIRLAITTKTVVRATYRGRLRLMCPHVLGVKGNRLHCLFYQFAGSSLHGLDTAGSWRCIAIDDLTQVSIEEGEWHSAVDYNPNSQTCVDEVDIAFKR